jgi:hypothetical protein
VRAVLAPPRQVERAPVGRPIQSMKLFTAT